MLAGVLAILVRAALNPILEDDHIFVVALLAVVYTSWQYGFKPGMLALVVGMVGYTYLFIPPRNTFYITGLGNQFSIALFFFCGVACAALGESQRVSQRRARGRWRPRSPGRTNWSPRSPGGGWSKRRCASARVN